MRLVAHISDLHFGRHDGAIVDALLAQFGEMRPHLVVLSGDLTQRARSAEFAQARKFIDRIAAPVVIVPGNHDIPLYNVMRRFFTPLEKYRRHIRQGSTSGEWYVDDELAVLGLNTARSLTFKSGRVSVDQMAMIRRCFEHVPQSAWKILVTHHPIASAHGEPRIELAGRAMLALRALTDAGVHVLLSGHHHRPASGHPATDLVLHETMLVVHAGTAVSTRTREGEGNSYNLVCLDGPHATIDVMRWNGRHTFEPARRSRYRLNNRGQLETETV
jgi:3',5'-cyclic AMP phosphodiesterase CpdA